MIASNSASEMRAGVRSNAGLPGRRSVADPSVPVVSVQSAVGSSAAVTAANATRGALARMLSKISRCAVVRGSDSRMISGLVMALSVYSMRACAMSSIPLSARACASVRVWRASRSRTASAVGAYSISADPSVFGRARASPVPTRVSLRLSPSGEKARNTASARMMSRASAVGAAIPRWESCSRLRRSLDPPSISPISTRAG